MSMSDETYERMRKLNERIMELPDGAYFAAMQDMQEQGFDASWLIAYAEEKERREAQDTESEDAKKGER